jgi:hypothetical protein
MALTLIIEGRPLRRPAASDLTAQMGEVSPGRSFVAAEVATALRACASEVRDVALRTSRGAEARAPRLILYRDSLQQIARKGHLPGVSVHAGEEIRDIYEVLMRVGSGGVGGYEMMVHLPCGDAIPAKFGVPVVERYLPWKAWAEGIWINRAGSVDLFTLTKRVCVEGMGPQQVAEACGVRRGRGIVWLQASLWRYAFLAGWVDDDIDLEGMLREAA